MENPKYKFKTNINCGSCVANVKPHLDMALGEGQWSVDTGDRNKILSVEACELNQEQIINLVEDAGYKIEPIQE